jgi:hypothetical protein
MKSSLEQAATIQTVGEEEDEEDAYTDFKHGSTNSQQARQMRRQDITRAQSQAEAMGATGESLRYQTRSVL